MTAGGDNSRGCVCDGRRGDGGRTCADVFFRYGCILRGRRVSTGKGVSNGSLSPETVAGIMPNSAVRSMSRCGHEVIRRARARPMRPDVASLQIGRCEHRVRVPEPASAEDAVFGHACYYSVEHIRGQSGNFADNRHFAYRVPRHIVAAAAHSHSSLMAASSPRGLNLPPMAVISLSSKKIRIE